MSEKVYVKGTEVAKMVRKELKVSFPETKFSVKTQNYTGGGNITVKWMDGPSEEQVKDRIGWMHGAEFDGMQDLKTYHDHTIEGQAVHFLNDYLFLSRDYSFEFLTAVAAQVSEEWGRPVPEVKRSDYNNTGYIEEDGVCFSNRDWEYHWMARQVIMRTARETAA